MIFDIGTNLSSNYDDFEVEVEKPIKNPGQCFGRISNGLNIEGGRHHQLVFTAADKSNLTMSLHIYISYR